MRTLLIILWILWVVGYPIYKKGYKKENIFDGSFFYPCIMLVLSNWIALCK